MRVESSSGDQKGFLPADGNNINLTHVIEIPSPRPAWKTNKIEQTLIIDNALKNNNPLFYAIANVVRHEGETLRRFTGWQIRNGNDAWLGRAIADGLIDVYEDLKWAKMLLETDGRIENHSDYIQDNKSILFQIDDMGIIDINIYRKQQQDEAETLSLIRKDPSGFKLLDLRLQQSLERFKQIGWEEHPELRAEYIGFKRGVQRYKALYEQNRVASGIT